jgi:hypothetical protein
LKYKLLLQPVQPQPVAVNTYPIPIHITLLEETKAAVQNFKEQVAEWQLTEEKKEQYIEFSQAPQNSEEALKQLEEWKLSAELKELYRKYYPFLKNPEPVFKSFEELSEDIMKRIARLPKEVAKLQSYFYSIRTELSSLNSYSNFSLKDSDRQFWTISYEPCS